MSDISELLDEIFPLIHERAITAFPEFGFKPRHNGYEATEGEIKGEKAKAHLYYYGNTPFCFKNHKTGETISLWKYVKKKDGLTDQETLETLADMAGYKLPDIQGYSSERAEKARERAEGLEKALTFFQSQLKEKNGKEVMKYLEEQRGYSEEEIEGMGLGYFPSKVGVKRVDLKSLGLDVKGMGTTHRLVIPYRDTVGRLKGLIVRRIDEIKDYKYLFSRGLEIDTPINFHEARGNKTVYLAEGVLDALIASERGMKGIVALGRASITDKQLQTLIRQGVKSIVVIPDNDQDGEAGAEKSLENINMAGLNAFVSVLPDGVKDVDEYLKTGGKIEDIKAKEISGAKWRANRILLKHNIETDRGKREALDEAITYAETLREYIDTQDFLTIIQGGLNIPLEELEEKLGDYHERQAKERLSGELKALSRKLQQGEIVDPAELEETVRELRLEHEKTRVKPSMSYADFLQEKHERDSKREAEFLGYKLKSFSEVAKKTDGIQAGFYILGADTNIGKTAFLTNVFLSLLFSNPEAKGIYFSLDDNKEVITNRFVSILSKIDLNKIQKKQDEAERAKKISSVYDTLKELARAGRLSVRDIAEVNHIDTLELMIRERAEDNLFVVIDGLYNLEVGKSYGGIREENIDRANKVKALVDTYSIPIITTGEVRKKGSEQKSRTPTVDDLMETGKFAYNANLVWMLYPENQENFKTEDTPTLVLEFAKNKLSYFRGRVKLTFIKAQGRIEEQTDIEPT